ncbi:sugar ABC transporter ATP-binding protein [Jannaschia sp. CCS1]|uniref:sugar ABC transporter ATP-binding protein n=1 Tax=Jannaschia sp. (strain CCS1) TaxID=290400 RepID=UPI000053B5B0|nr:sugar ABC transporter ATP-binding protein [Jannaschia sp. CCS1]ABD55322.1 monosaccharide ABC transporter ATP-binding protein, CUT2 family [Jannaschia sp. CCS1]
MQTLTFKHMSKAYNGLPALSDVAISLSGGRVHAVMGENGAGKSTLIKLIAGVVKADGLEVEKDGSAVPLASAQDAQDAGFRFIHQELNIVPQISVAENILLGHRYPRRFGLAVDWPAVKARARDALAFLGADHIDVLSLAGDLPAGDKMLIKIAAALVTDPDKDVQTDLYVLDEPTAALTGAESEMLFAVIERLTASGAAVLYVSHRMEEVLRICDDVTVLRNGRLVSTNKTRDVTKDQIIHDMTGRDVKDAYPPRATGIGRDVVARLDGVATSALSDLTFTLRAGEIIGVAGLSEAGQTQLLEIFMGLHPVRAGRVDFQGGPLPRTPARAWASGVAYLPKERRSEGLMLDMSIRANITAPHLGGYGLIAKPRRETDGATAMGGQMRMKYDDIEQAVGQLSGGNQQKVVFARALYGSPRLLLLNEPTRGVDVGAKFDIYSTVRELSGQGCAILLTSSDLPEMLGMCDRILVLQDGRQTHLLDSAALTSAALLSHFYAPDAKA